jgi:D-alanyl-D-alanine carboxypeptidase
VSRVPLVLGALALFLVLRGRRASAATGPAPSLGGRGGPPFKLVPWNKPHLAGKRILQEFPYLRPENMVKVQAPDSTRGSKPVHRLTADAYLAMVQAARADGIAAPMLELNSGFRTDAEQKVIWDRRLQLERSRAAEKGESVPDSEIIKRARKMVAPPETSNHRTGYTIDLNLGRSYSEKNIPLMRQEPAWQWLNKNAIRFGFYPYEVEPWHWEYNPPQVSAPIV